MLTCDKCNYWKVGPIHWPLFLLWEEIWENSASLAALHHTKTLDRGQQLLRNPNYWNCVNFAKIAAALQLTMWECKLLAIFPELLCDQRNGERGGEGEFCKMREEFKSGSSHSWKRGLYLYALNLNSRTHRLLHFSVHQSLIAGVYALVQ